MLIRSVLSLFILFMVSCVPKPSEVQVGFDSNVIGNIHFVESPDLGIMPVGQVYAFTMTLINTGKLDASYEPLALDKESDIITFPGGEYPGSGGTCGNVLKSGESCKIVLQVYGNDTGDFSQGFSLNYKNGIEKTKFEGSFTGYLGREAKLEITEGKKFDYGIVEPFEEKNHFITVKNTGELNAVNLIGFFDPVVPADDIYQFTGGFFPGSGGTCGTIIKGGDECSLNISSMPVEAGRISKATFKLTYKNPASAKTLSYELETTSAEIKAYVTVIETETNLGSFLNSGPSNEKYVTWTFVNNGLAPAKNITLNDVGTMPLTLDSTTCPASGLLPQETCQSTYKFQPAFAEPLTPPMAFPIIYSKKILTFSYHDGKYPTPAITNETLLSAEIKGEAHLKFFRDGDNNLQFSDNALGVSGSDQWLRSEWMSIIGSTSASHNLKITNSSYNTSVPAKSITYEIIPDDGFLISDCISSNSCITQLDAGNSITIPVRYSPQYVVPYVPNKDYTLKITYHSGRRTKSYDLQIQTRSTAVPLVSISSGGTTLLETSSVEMSSILAGMTVKKTFQITNTGPTDYTPVVTLTNPATLANFSMPPASDNCQGAVLKNGGTCTFEIEFTKAGWNGGTDNTSQTMTFNNGLEASDPNYKSFVITLIGEVVGPGYFEYTAGPINFGNIPWSQPGLNDRTYSKDAPLTKKGGWEISQFEMELTGPDASYFVLGPSTANAEPIINGKFNGAFIPRISLTTPSPGGKSPLNANLVIRYYGNAENDFSGFDPADVITIPISATPQNEPFLNIVSVPEELGPIPKDMTDTELITVNNTGQAPANAKLNVTGNDFTLADSPGGVGCTALAQVNTKTITFTISPGAECSFTVTFKSPGAGKISSSAVLEYSDSDTALSTQEGFFGEGLALAVLSNAPASASGRDYNNFGNIKYGDTVTKTFTISNIAINSTPAEIVSVTLLAPGTNGCSATSSLHTEWVGLNQVNGANNGFTINSHDCTTGKQLSSNGTDKCEITINFTPKHVNEIIGACFEIRYREYPGSPTIKPLTQKVMAKGLVPEAVFNGWHRIFAEGETDDLKPKIKLQWKAMSVVSGLGTVKGYNVYRRLQGSSLYPNKPLNAVMIISPVEAGIFQFTDEQNEANDDYPETLTASKIYQYLVKPVVELPGIPGINETTTTQFDKDVRVILPPPYTVLMHRWTANIIGCVNLLDKAYGDLVRNSHYACSYNGPGSAGGVLDIGMDLIIDRYENGAFSSEPTNNPVPFPHLYNDLASAKASCTAQKETIEQAQIYNKSKRLIKRKEYMYLSNQQSTVGCISNSPTLENTGRNECKSLYGAEDLIGNAWDIIDTEINHDFGTTWLYGDNSELKTQSWRLPIPVLDFDTIAFLDHTTFMIKDTFGPVTSPCLSVITGMPLRDNAGVCPSGSKSHAAIGNTMNASADKFHILTLGNTEEAFAQWEGKRILFAGGSHNSVQKYNVEANRYTIYWTDGYIDTIMQTYLPSPWEGGAARCVLEVAY